MTAIKIMAVALQAELREQMGVRTSVANCEAVMANVIERTSALKLENARSPKNTDKDIG
jgi:bacterioferritin-associated ferredoxin